MGHSFGAGSAPVWRRSVWRRSHSAPVWWRKVVALSVRVWRLSRSLVEEGSTSLVVE